MSAFTDSSCVLATDRRKSLFVKLCQTCILKVAESLDEMQARQFFDTPAYRFSSQQLFLYTVLCPRYGTFCCVA